MARSARLALAWAASLSAPALAAPSKLSCDGQASCSPKECVVNTEGDCSLNVVSVDYAATIAGLPCRTCTPSTASVCTDPGANFITAGGHVKAAWCNDDFLVVATDGKPQYDANTALKGIPLPPGGGDSCRVRTAEFQPLVYKIPLSPVKLAAGGSNTFSNPLPGVPGMPAAGAVAVGLDGVPIFPNYNNRGKPTWVSCEVDYCNAHAGKGADYHYHGDPFGSRCLYSESNYSSATAHPPIIGFALDGYKIFGRYTETTQEGQEVALDSCGGHDHTTLGYHYHPQITTGTTTELDGVSNPGTVTYTKYDGAPAECLAGDVSKIANFFESGGRQINHYSKTGLCTRNDLENIKPCCGMTKYYAAPGITPNTVAGDGTCSSGTSGSGSGTGTGGGTGTGNEEKVCQTGGCEGTDDKGKACPATFDAADKPCPRGCSVICPIPTPAPPPAGGPGPTPAPPTPTPAPPPTPTQAPAATTTVAAVSGSFAPWPMTALALWAVALVAR